MRASPPRSGWAVAATCLTLLVVCGCGSDPGDSAWAREHTDSTPGSTRVAESGRSPSPVVATVNAEPDLKSPVVRIADLAGHRQAELIVAGTVSSVAYTPAPDIPKTRFVVAVSETYKGSAPETVSVVEHGGYVRVADLSVPGKAGARFGDDTNLPGDGWVDSRIFHAGHPDVGDEVLLFLYRGPDDTGYREVASVFGRLTLDDAGRNYVRPTDGGGVFERSIPRTQLLRALGAAG